jgi:outer membrane protein assembly factor BamB
MNKKLEFLEKNKGKAVTTIALILILLAPVVITSISLAQAAVPNQQLKTYAYIACNPTPVGVGQLLQVSFWLADPPVGASGAVGPRWETFTVTISKPDGTTETRGPFTSDAVGAAYFAYYPSSVGAYQFQMSYTGQRIAGMYSLSFAAPPTEIDYTYLPSTSNTFTVIVQQNPVTAPPQNPLPTTFWSRPIYGDSLSWTAISSNWLMASWNSTERAFDSGSAFSPEGTSPNSAHILWTKSMGFGGLVGGLFGDVAYHNGQSYEQWLTPPTMINGYLYYNSIVGQEPITSGNMGSAGIVCVNLRTGETMFTVPNATLSFGQIFKYTSPNQAGAHAYLWDISGAAWKMFDASTGNYMLSILNPPAGTVTFGVNGEVVVYSIDAIAGTVSMWNATKAIHGKYVILDTEDWMWRPIGGTFFSPAYEPGREVNGTAGYQWTVHLTNTIGQAIIGFVDNDIVTSALVGNNEVFTGYNMKTGAVEFTSTAVPPADWPQAFAGGFGTYGYVQGVYYVFLKQVLQWTAYDVKTGQQKWTSASYTNPWGLYNTAGNIVDENNFYTSGYDGMINAHSKATGQLLWSFSSGNAGIITPYGTWPIYGGLVINDGKVFGVTGDHGNGVTTLYTGEAIYAINAATGKEVWSISGWFERPSVADGMLVAHNDYDGKVYCFGKGPSSITVEAPLVGVSKGQTLVIQGRVTDQSSGAKAKVESGEFSIVPAVSDASMRSWMEYIYMQKAKPTNALGIPVKLTATDANGNTMNIAAVTSDSSGLYSFTWNPEQTGTFIIKAAFEGSESYYPCSTETTVSITSVASTAATPPLDLYIIVATIIILIAIAIVAILHLRKH